MELTELFTLIQNTLYKQGFKLTPLLRNSMTSAHFIISDEDLVRRQVSPDYNYQAFFGNWLEVNEVSRRNGAKYNTSYYLEIVECKNSSGKTVKKIKLKCDQTEQTLVRKVNKFITEYKNYLLEKKIEELLK